MATYNHKWINYAKVLNIGQSVRVCHCGSSKDAVIYHQKDKYNIYCYKCKFYEHVKKEYVRLVGGPVKTCTNRLPHDLTDKLPDVCYELILDKGLHLPMMEGYSWSFSQSEDRLFFGWLQGTEESDYYYVSRALSAKDTRKWMLYPHVSTGNFVSYCDVYKGYPRIPDAIVLTEDLFSAIKVQYVADKLPLSMKCVIAVIACLGTVVSNSLRLKLHTQQRDVFVWFDGDKAGEEGIQKAKRMLRGFMPVSGFVVKGKDPKDLSCKDIENTLLQFCDTYFL